MVNVDEKTLTVLQVQEELRLIEPEAKQDLDDELYFLPELAWLDEFGPWCKQNCPPWEPEKGDCDDQARWARNAANEAIRKATGIVGRGQAFGICKVSLWPGLGFLGLQEQDDIAAHVFNLVRCRANPWMAFQPTNGLYAPLAPAVDAGVLSVLSFGL